MADPVAATFRSPRPPSVWRRKRIRLGLDSYVGNYAYHLTLVTANRRTLFARESVVQLCRVALASCASIEGFALLAYVFMPDHLHILTAGSDDARLAQFMKRFKQESGFHFKREMGENLWQKGYHDHVVRFEEDLNELALYIAYNPVRAGLIRDWNEYPYWGGELLLGALAGDLKVAATSPCGGAEGESTDDNL